MLVSVLPNFLNVPMGVVLLKISAYMLPISSNCSPMWPFCTTRERNYVHSFYAVLSSVSTIRYFLQRRYDRYILYSSVPLSHKRALSPQRMPIKLFCTLQYLFPREGLLSIRRFKCSLVLSSITVPQESSSPQRMSKILFCTLQYHRLHKKTLSPQEDTEM